MRETRLIISFFPFTHMCAQGWNCSVDYLYLYGRVYSDVLRAAQPIILHFSVGARDAPRSHFIIKRKIFSLRNIMKFRARCNIVYAQVLENDEWSG